MPFFLLFFLGNWSSGRWRSRAELSFTDRYCLELLQDPNFHAATPKIDYFSDVPAVWHSQRPGISRMRIWALYLIQKSPQFVPKTLRKIMWEDGKLVFSIISALAVVKKPSFSCFCSVDLSLGEAAWNFCEKKKRKKKGFFCSRNSPSAIKLTWTDSLGNNSKLFPLFFAALLCPQLFPNSGIIPSSPGLGEAGESLFFLGGEEKGAFCGNSEQLFFIFVLIFFWQPKFCGFFSGAKQSSGRGARGGQTNLRRDLVPRWQGNNCF